MALGVREPKMKIAICAFAALIALTAVASAQYPTSLPCSRPDESNLQTHNCYINMDGNPVHSPAAPKNSMPPLGASAQCADGTSSFSQHRRGTCSHHGGVVN